MNFAIPLYDVRTEHSYLCQFQRISSVVLVQCTLSGFLLCHNFAFCITVIHKAVDCVFEENYFVICLFHTPQLLITCILITTGNLFCLIMKPFLYKQKNSPEQFLSDLRCK